MGGASLSQEGRLASSSEKKKAPRARLNGAGEPREEGTSWRGRWVRCHMWEFRALRPKRCSAIAIALGPVQTIISQGEKPDV